MENKVMRELDVIMKDLTAAAKDIQVRRSKLEELNTEQSLAFQDVEAAQTRASELRSEMEEFMNLLVPSSLQNRVR
jgi:hypothetical protein